MYKKNLKKIDIVNNLSNSTGFSSNLSKKLIDDLIEIIIQSIKSGHLNLKNIGTFKVINKNQRIGRNPRTNEEFIITSRNSLSYIPSKNIKELNKILWANC